MKNLALVDLEKIDKIVTPEQWHDITLDSPAESIFTDFHELNPLTVEARTLAVDALKLMREAHVHMKIVISKDGDFLGIISTHELQEQNIIHEISKGIARSELRVSDLMLTRSALHAFDFAALQEARVADVVNALQNHRVRHCLVLDKKHHHIRGVISSSDIARKLKLPVEIDMGTSFSKIFSAIHQPEIVN